MMQDITAFAFDDALFRVAHRAGAPWFVLVDTCRVLEHSNPSQAASRLDDDEKGIISSDTLGGRQDVIVISESGLYSLILTSRKPEAKRFKKWITAELLPTLRKTGRYQVQTQADDEPWQWASDLGELHARLSMVRESRLIAGNASARALWLKLGLDREGVAFTREVGRSSVPDAIQATADAIVLLLDRSDVSSSWSGTATDLLAALKGLPVRGLPGTAQSLGIALDRARDPLQDLGIEVMRHHSGIRRVVLRRVA